MQGYSTRGAGTGRPGYRLVPALTARYGALVLLAALLITIASFEQATLMTLGAGKGQGVYLGTV